VQHGTQRNAYPGTEIFLQMDGFDWILLCSFMLVFLAAGQGVGNSPFTLEVLPPTTSPIATIQTSITSHLLVSYPSPAFQSCSTLPCT
jgi:hypothetical protein